MSKIKSITVHNLKAVSALTADFNGCTAIVTGKNNAGKTSFLRGIFDRLRGNKADQTLKQGETEGFAEAVLTTGEKIKWEFNDKGKGFKEKLTYITEKEIKTSMSVELRDRFCPETFDVDKFLNDTPQKQRKTLQDLAGLDFTDIDARYSEAYKERTAANTRAADAKTLSEAAVMPVKVDEVGLQSLLDEKEQVRKSLNDMYIANKNANDDARVEYQNLLTKFNNDVLNWNEKQSQHTERINVCEDLLLKLQDKGYTGKEVTTFIEGLPKSKPHSFVKPTEPTYITELPDNAPLIAIETKIEAAHEQNRKAAIYDAWLALQKSKDEYAAAAVIADNAVKLVETERLNLIKTANMPEGFSFTDEGIAYNGMAFTREQLSSSGIYIAALKLASMKIGEIRTLHFDASFLDKNSLADIEKWASENDLQLLIERHDFEGGEIEYQLISNL